MTTRPAGVLAPAALGLLVAVGCAVASRTHPKTQNVFAGEPQPVCDAKSCPDKWSMVQIWLTHHSTMKMQMVTDTVIETYNPTNSVPAYGFTIIKEPAGNGSYRIVMEMVCGHPRGCRWSRDDMRNIFYRYLNTGEDFLAKRPQEVSRREPEKDLWPDGVDKLPQGAPILVETREGSFKGLFVNYDSNVLWIKTSNSQKAISDNRIKRVFSTQ